MGYLETLNNKNLKKLLKKKYLTEELLNEIKTSVFIHPCTDNGDNTYSFNPIETIDGEIIELFTSFEEYYESYPNNDEFVPEIWYFNQFYDTQHNNALGIIINPKTDKLFIPTTLCIHIMEDIIELEDLQEIFKKEYSFEDLKKLKGGEMDYLSSYLENKTKIVHISKLFSLFEYSHPYGLIYSDKSLDKYFKDEFITPEDVIFNFYKKEDYIMIFSNKESIHSEIKDKDGFYYPTLSDMVEMVKLVLELDYNGIILKHNDTEFLLERHRLLKYYTQIIEEYHPIPYGTHYAFKLEE